MASLAGCTAGAVDDAAPTATPAPPATTALPLAQHGSPPDICQRGLVDVGIYAIDEPAFAEDWTGVDIPGRYAAGGTLTDDDVVIGLEHDGLARAYPLSVLWHHEIVNDTVGVPVIVTYCSLCRSGLVASRVVDGTARQFGVSGQLWVPPELETRLSEANDRVFAVERRNASPGRVRNSGNLVMYDTRTLSFWSQMLGRAICGPHRGQQLTIRPSTATTWADWVASYPDTEVLLPPPHSTLIPYFP